MFDMHSHILPNVDDGAKNIGVALEMLKIATENGTTDIVATPHAIAGEWMPDWQK
jgi:protein-tyrosine phosphatase